MIVTWMIGATVLAALCAAAAVAAERALRALNRPRRVAWVGALSAALVWPVLGPLLLSAARTNPSGARVLLPVIGSSVAAMGATVSRVEGTWRGALGDVLLAAWFIVST